LKATVEQKMTEEALLEAEGIESVDQHSYKVGLLTVEELDELTERKKALLKKAKRPCPSCQKTGHFDKRSYLCAANELNIINIDIAEGKRDAPVPKTKAKAVAKEAKAQERQAAKLLQEEAKAAKKRAREEEKAKKDAAKKRAREEAKQKKETAKKVAKENKLAKKNAAAKMAPACTVAAGAPAQEKDGESGCDELLLVEASDVEEMLRFWDDGKVRSAELAESLSSSTGEHVEAYGVNKQKKELQGIFDDLEGSKHDIFDDNFNDDNSDETFF
jgi:hypothetical protein